MRLTLIDDDNIRFFENAIGDRYAEKKENELFAGVIDDEKKACAAAAFSEQPEGLYLEHIAVDDERRRQGIGSFLIGEMKKTAKSSGITNMYALFFADENDEGSEDFTAFLEKNGFTITRPEVKRTIYDIQEVLSLPPFVKGPLKRPFRIKTPTELSEKDMENINGIDDPMVDPEDVSSYKNRYGCVLFEKDEIRAILVAEMFGKGIRIGTLYSTGEGASLFAYLFEHAINIARCESTELEELVVDTAGEKMEKFEKLFFEKMKVRSVKSFRAVGAEMQL